MSIQVEKVLVECYHCYNTVKRLVKKLRSLGKTMRNYCVTKKEMLALITFIQHFSQFLRTDHSALRWILSFKEPENQTARWLEILSRYEFIIIHRPGKKHINADVLSRTSCDPKCDCYDGQTSNIVFSE